MCSLQIQLLDLTVHVVLEVMQPWIMTAALVACHITGVYVTDESCLEPEVIDVGSDGRVSL